MKFTKMQGAGNDFIVLDNRSGEYARTNTPLSPSVSAAAVSRSARTG